MLLDGGSKFCLEFVGNYHIYLLSNWIQIFGFIIKTIIYYSSFKLKFYQKIIDLQLSCKILKILWYCHTEKNFFTSFAFIVVLNSGNTVNQTVQFGTEFVWALTYLTVLKDLKSDNKFYNGQCELLVILGFFIYFLVDFFFCCCYRMSVCCCF